MARREGVPIKTPEKLFSKLNTETLVVQLTASLLRESVQDVRINDGILEKVKKCTSPPLDSAMAESIV